MGGRGKTPLVAHVANLLVAAGERPAILSRGYGRRVREDGVVIVSDGTHVTADLDRSGDEPLMLARAVPGASVLVCEQRAIAAALAERVLNATVHVMDDGFQHRSMRRDVDIVAVAPKDLEGRAVPFGRMRQSPASLASADALVIETSPEEREGTEVITARFQCPVFEMRRHLGAPVAIDGADRAIRPGAKVVAVAGIANPSRFQEALEAAGWSVARMLPFGDHHRYSQADIRAIERAVQETGADGVLTTDKDAVRLRPLRPFAVPVAAVPLTITLDPAAEFESWLLTRVREARA